RRTPRRSCPSPGDPSSREVVPPGHACSAGSPLRACYGRRHPVGTPAGQGIRFRTRSRGRACRRGRVRRGEERNTTMVRGIADRAFLPTKNLLEEVGDMMILTGKTIMSAIQPPYPYGGEFVGQFLFALKLSWFALVIYTVAFGYGAPGLQA